jgi:serpin B
MVETELAQHLPAIRALAARWLPVVADDSAVRAEAGNFVCSPVGLWLALGVVAAGARMDTARELRDLLGAAGPDAAVAATAAVHAIRQTAGLTVATGAWARTPIYRAFRDGLPQVHFGHLDPDDPAAVDSWVSRATHGMITRLPARPTEETQLLLVNALAVRADWETPFPRLNTADRPFTDAHGGRHRVPTMVKDLPRPSHAWTAPGPTGGTVEVVALRCAAREGQEQAQVSLVLGEPGRTAAEVLPAAWAPHEVRRPIDADQITVAVPRLSLRTPLDPSRHLPALGAGQVLTPMADLSEMSPEPLRVGQIAQETRLRIDELGVAAAAVTEVPAHRKSVTERLPRIRHIAFDRPFGLVVFAGGSGVPLFAAWQASAPRAA